MCDLTGKGLTAPSLFCVLRVFSKDTVPPRYNATFWLRVEVKQENEKFHSEIRHEAYPGLPAGKIC